VSPRRLRSRWESYLSTEVEVVLARARQVLAPPASVELVVESDVPGAAILGARGEASPDWVERAARTQVPGVARIDLSALIGEVPAELTAAATALASRRVLFEVGSAALDDAARREVAAALATIGELDRIASAAGYRAIVELVGRTDEAGTQTANLELSMARAHAVREALVAAGLSGGRALGVRGAGSDEPIGAGAEPEARLNRSVSFAASLQPTAPRLSSSPR
jgi:outer membrane protein OmpA-like peptidoglycan-associated protein